MSDVDATIPADYEKASKSEFRENFRVIKEELETLEAKTNYARDIAFGKLSL